MSVTPWTDPCSCNFTGLIYTAQKLGSWCSACLSFPAAPVTRRHTYQRRLPECTADFYLVKWTCQFAVGGEEDLLQTEGSKRCYSPCRPSYPSPTYPSNRDPGPFFPSHHDLKMRATYHRQLAAKHAADTQSFPVNLKTNGPGSHPVLLIIMQHLVLLHYALNYACGQDVSFVIAISKFISFKCS